MTASTCSACQGTWPRKDHCITDCGLCVTYLAEDQFFPGWTLVVLKRHATELFQLSSDERGQMVDEVSRVAQALATVFRSVKVNYELLGNQLPHIHWHVIPRLAEDPSPREAVWTVRHPKRLLSEAELKERLRDIRSALEP